MTLLLIYSVISDTLELLTDTVKVTELNCYLTLVPPITSASYWKMASRKGYWTRTTNPHLIAARILARGGPITHHDINAVLGHQNISITQVELDQLLALEGQTFNLKGIAGETIDTTLRDNFYKQFPKSTSDPQWGIYLFTNLITGECYYGSSIVLGERLRHYWKKHSKLNLRLILADILKTGIHNFSVTVWVFPQSLREMRLLLALEQYHILNDAPANNSILVAAGSPGGKHLAAINALNSIPVFMYQGETLLYKFNSAHGNTNSLISLLKMNKASIYRVLWDSDAKYLNTFTFTRLLLGEIQYSTLLSGTEVATLVNKTRTWYNETNQVHHMGGKAKAALATSLAVNIIRVSDGKVWYAANYRAARTLAATVVGKTMTTDTLKNRLTSGVPLNGFRYEHAK